MFTKFLNFLNQPEFEGEDGKTRQAMLLNQILWGYLGIVVLILIGTMIFYTVWSLVAAITVFIITLGLRVLMVRGRVNLSAHLLVLLSWGALVTAMFFSGGLQSFILVTFPTLIIMTIMLVGARTGIFLLAFGLVTSILALYLENVNRLPKVVIPNDISPIIWITLAGSLFIAVTVQLLATTSLRRAVLQLRANNAALQETQASLEQQVVERTQYSEAARQEAEAARFQLESQVWFTSGQVQLNEAIRREQDLFTLANGIAQVLCKRLNANVAVVYIREENYLEWAGGFAFPTEAKCQFRLGETLVGQACQDKQPVFLNEVPASYFPIGSGLGETYPRLIIIWPFIYNEEVVGAIEMGLLIELTPIQRQFLERANDTIAAAIHTAKTRARVDNLLAKTQSQAEELQMREEELRSVNEELEAQAESLRSIRSTKG